MFVNGSGRNEQNYRGPSIDASYQVSVQEGEINVNEASKVLQKMNNNKSHGSDCFSAEFFWIDLKSFVVNSINLGSLLGEISLT